MKIEILRMHNDHSNTNAWVGRESARIDDLEDQQEKTGEVFKIETHEKIKKYEENERHWSRYFITGGIAIFFTGLSILIGYLLHMQVH